MNETNKPRIWTARALAAITTITATAVMAFAATPALAAHGSTRIDQRQHHQAQRIQQGVASGTLTRHEARHLQGQQRQITRYEQQARADGRISVHERQHLAAMQAAASRSIRHQKHDAQMRHWR